MGTSHGDQYTFLITHRSILRMRKIFFQTEIVDKIKTQILCLITFCRKSCLYEIMWTKNLIEPDRPQMEIWRTAQITIWRTAHCMLYNYDYKHTLGICITYCFSNATVVARVSFKVRLYVHVI